MQLTNDLCKKSAVLVCSLIAAFLFFNGHKAFAATYNVTTSSACTLNNAISAADTGIPVGSCAAGDNSNVIDMASGMYNLSGDLPAITNHDLTVNGAGPEQTIINGNNEHQMFDIESVGLNTVFSNFTTIGAAGVNDTWYSIADNASGGTLNISNVVLRDSTIGGGVSIDEPGSITNSSIDNVRSPNGGMIQIIFSSGVFNITNTTIEGGNGAEAVWVDDNGGGTVNLVNDTIANNSTNSAPAGAGIEIWDIQGPGLTVNLENTILDNNYIVGNPNTPDNCSTSTFVGLPSELPTSLGHNISNDATCSAAMTLSGDKNSVDPLLGSLLLDANTYVFPITTSSPAYNAADPSSSPATDQRGVVRPQCGTYDVGAYELIHLCQPITNINNGLKAPNTGYGVNTSRKTSVYTLITISLGLLLLAGICRRIATKI